MLTIGIRKSEKFVRQQQTLGNDLRWDGWDMVFFRPDERGVYSKDGAYRNGQWGFENRVTVNENGIWEIDYRNVRRTRRARH